MIPRATTIIALSQTLVIILGFVAVGVVLKASGYPENPMRLRWNPLALFLRHYGLLLLVVPVIWTYFTARSLRDDCLAVTYRTMMGVGVLVAALTITIFIYAALFPFTRPLFLRL